jgi:NDP-sugar pyrophosphorylase family protein
MSYTVFIPTAGIGSRLKGLSKRVNKALVDINGKPSISYVVEKFSKKDKFIIALGYKGDDVKDFLEITYPEMNFEFVWINPYKGDESGLGLTMIQCKDFLQTPFIFCSNDTIVEEEIPAPDHNWAGFSQTADTSEYRSFKINNNLITEVCAKNAEGDVYPYIGLCGIFDYKIFWSSMLSNDISKKVGESYGLQDLISHKVTGYEFKWFDTGNIDSITNARDSLLNEYEDINVLPKEEEAIWFCNGKVIKFHTDQSFISNRVKRAEKLYPYTPKIIGSSKHLYGYEMIEGQVLSKHPSVDNFISFLDWMNDFWVPADLKRSEADHFRALCLNFYKDKTLARVKDFLEKFEVHDVGGLVNGVHVDDAYTLLNQIDWDDISDGWPCQFHGDLHFENILISTDNQSKFTLLDWRQDFSGNTDVGDIYYDLAKLNHGFIISHEIISNENYSFSADFSGNIQFDFHRKNSLIDCQHVLEDWVKSKQLSWQKVQLLTALIFLNIASLHHYPYSNLLFYLGKSRLQKFLSLNAQEARLIDSS